MPSSSSRSLDNFLKAKFSDLRCKVLPYGDRSLRFSLGADDDHVLEIAEPTRVHDLERILKIEVVTDDHFGLALLELIL